MALTKVTNNLLKSTGTTSGTIPVLGSGARIPATANLNLYVATTGSDTNDGLTVGTPKHTIQAAIDLVHNSYDLRGYDCYIYVADGTYAGSILVNIPQLGSTQINIIGNTTTPSNCILTSSTSHTVEVCNSKLRIRGFKFTNTGSNLHCIFAHKNGHIAIDGKVEFGSTVGSGDHIQLWDGSELEMNYITYTISGNAGHHLNSYACSRIWATNNTVTLTGTPAFAGQFVSADYTGLIFGSGSTYSGSATGVRYNALRNGIIDSGSAGANYFPGSAAGGVSNGGIYV